jgi:heat-inducible transcriptional repressor
MITELNERSREIFRLIVDAFLENGAPVGSRTLSRFEGLNLSAASIRNVMADLEEIGLLSSPHTSAGRLPTQAGLRLYVDGLMQAGNLSAEEKSSIQAACQASEQSMDALFERASGLLSGLSSCASVVLAPRLENPVKQIQFVPLEPGKVLVVIVAQNGLIENRMMDVPLHLSFSDLEKASNYLNAQLKGQSLSDIRAHVLATIEERETSLDDLSKDLIRRGLALPGSGTKEGHIIVRGQSRLLEDVKAIEDLERARMLFELLEEEKSLLQLLDHTRSAQGIQIFIGTENKMFNSQDWSTVLSPYRNADNQVVGMIGVIGPVHLNYGRIVPIVDYTAKVMSRMIGDKS